MTNHANSLHTAKKWRLSQLKYLDFNQNDLAFLIRRLQEIKSNIIKPITKKMLLLLSFKAVRFFFFLLFRLHFP